MRALRSAWKAVALEHSLIAAAAALMPSATATALRAGATTYSA
jgi:hypothetical protein